MAKPNQNQTSRSFSTKILVGSNRLFAAAIFAWPLSATVVSRNSVCRVSIGDSFRSRPNRERRIELESFGVIADGRRQLALLFFLKLFLPPCFRLKKHDGYARASNASD